MRDTLESLVRDLSIQLTGMANMVGDRVQQIGRQRADADARVPDQPAMLALCGRLREQRRRRAVHFPGELFHEPSWDMLLMLYVARVERRTLYVKTLVLAADAPITTSQRWIEHLARLGLAIRTEDAADRRRVAVRLSDAGRDAMEAYLAAMLRMEQG